MADVVLTGFAANDPVPGDYLEMNWAQGPVAGANIARSILICANKTASGTAVVDTTIYGPDTVVQCVTEGDVITLFGAGSELHIAWRVVTKANPNTAVYLLAVAESAGAKATSVLTIATTATGPGTLRVLVGDIPIEVAIATGDTPTVIAAAFMAEANRIRHLPVVVSVVAGAITFTHKNFGPRGNQVRYFAQIISLTSIATTVSPSVDTALASGATADSVTNALATLAGRFYYYQVWAHADATNAPLIMAQLDAQALPLVGNRQRVFLGSVGTLSAANVTSVACNTALAKNIWSENNPWTALQLAAQTAAAQAFEEIPENPRTNFAGYGNDPETQSRWFVPAPRADGDAPTRAELVSALNNGTTPIGVTAAKKTYIVKMITTRSLTGSVNDYRIREDHKVTVCHRFADDWLARVRLTYNGFRIADDPARGRPLPGPRAVCPSMMRGNLNGLLNIYDGRTLIQDVATTIANAVVQRSVSNRARMEVRVPLKPIDNFEQSATAIDQL